MAFKLKHKRTGMWFGKSLSKFDREHRSYKTNLRKIAGSLYENKPTEKQLKNWFHSYCDETGKNIKFDITDFEIVEI